MISDERPVALVTGGSAGLGFVISQKLLRAGYRVVIVGRNRDRLNEAVGNLESEGNQSRAGAHDSCLAALPCDLTDAKAVEGLLSEVSQLFGRLDVLINCVGASDRGMIETLDPERAEFLFRQNVITALLCSQQAIPALQRSGGVIVNIGSLASKVGARYIGGYAIAKHALAGMTQQLRLELKPRGIHVCLVSPGPIRREDEGQRYQASAEGLPVQAARPGGGARVSGLPPERVADAVLAAIRKRKPDVILPRYLRLLIMVGHALPRLGDWLLLKFTSPKKD
jgi:NAD(P)-dependent dehydrogenase (short-subunit alcohol dehydrogenase family)|tara:strand:+ start:786 stop:1631 length:846 start_codon:yes stop_codon:yes gene_type:complete